MNITEKRIDKMLSLIKSSIVVEKLPVDTVLFKECDYKQGTVMPSDDGFSEFHPSDTWGSNTDTHGWFILRGSIPKKYSFCTLRLHCDTSKDGWNVYNPQFIAYIDGKAMQGLDANHRSMEFSYRSEYEIYLYAYTGSLCKNLDFKAYFEVVDTNAESLFYDLSVMYETAKILNESSKEYADIIASLTRTLDIIDFRDTSSTLYRTSLKNAESFITNTFYNTKCHESNVKVVCVGHTHIDVAWLWTLDMTKEKAQHTFSTVLALMDKYPSLVFMSSQPQLLKYVKEEDPLLYERIKEKVKEGRFELEGGMWVEADCNLTSGESLVRQLIHGKRFFMDEFGVDSKILWLPDVFGYSASLPQICRKAGIDTFVTSKISWNDTNRMPHDVFEWTGIDGTKIFTYFLTAQDKKRDTPSANYTTYVATSDPEYIAGCYDRFSDKSLSDEVLLTMGWGDGGGGPTMKMCEKLVRVEKGLPGIPTAKSGKVVPFIENLKSSVYSDGRIPKWDGELYLEYHRGTYTVAAKNKLFNRKAEFANKNAELWSAASNIFKKSDYPDEELYNNWEITLLNQFHDIIPGSSIPQVYKTSRKQYAEILASDKSITEKAFASLCLGDGKTVFNPNFVKKGTFRSGDEYVYCDSLPQAGASTSKYKNTNSVVFTDNSLENRFYVITFTDGYISSVYDKEEKRVVSTSLGKLIAFEDIPFAYDCWNLEEYHEEKPYNVNGFVSMEKIERGCGAGFRIKRTFMSSEIVQEILIFDDTRRIDFVTHADWKEKNIILKAEFDADINNTDGTFDIQYGFTKRQANRNTSWEKAKFEMCGQKYCDISDGGYGLAVINDCKYGHSLGRGKITLSLIKSSGYPNEFIDCDTHEFVYSAFFHSGDFRTSGVIDEAILINDPPVIFDGKTENDFSLISTECDNIVLGAVKKSYDKTGYIFRLAESFDKYTIAEFTFGFDIKKAFVCDLNENEDHEIECQNRKLNLSFKPFEIITLKII